MRPFSIIVFLLIINSSFSLFCYEQITNGEEKIIPCDTLCYTNVRITESLTEIVRRGCSDRLPFNVRATIYLTYGIYVEKPLCTGIGSINIHFGELEVIERLCCGSDHCNEMPELTQRR